MATRNQAPQGQPCQLQQQQQRSSKKRGKDRVLLPLSQGVKDTDWGDSASLKKNFPLYKDKKKYVSQQVSDGPLRLQLVEAVPQSAEAGGITDLFERSFGGFDGDGGGERATLLPLVRCAAAPGRVNLIGEHTDYTGGYVLPLAIGYNTVVFGRGGVVADASGGGGGGAAPTSRVASADRPSVAEFAVGPDSTPSTSSADAWADYVHGVAAQYLPDLPPGKTFAFDVAVAGDVPLGSGLSSSASLEVATAVFLEGILEGCSGAARSARGEAPTTAKEAKMERAVRCQRAENEFCGVPCGIMDQFVSSAGREGKLLLIDCRSLDFREVSAGDGGGDDAPVLVVTNSNVKHSLGDGEYPVRVRQCKEATEILSKANPRIATLRDATTADVEAAASSAGLEGVLLRRARHVVSENERTVEAANALERGDWATVGRLMNESHDSMRDDYDVSCDEIDVLVELARGFEGVYGSRLTGGGFGGCTVTLVRRDSSRRLIEHLGREYEKRTGKKCVCFETSPGNGARAIGL
ncbi:hypothetical protein ACHAWF_018426 [Thalassiosira exigua]